MELFNTVSVISFVARGIGMVVILIDLLAGHKQKMQVMNIGANEPECWLMMQAGMLLGFLTAYPVKWWLIDKSIKERI